MKLNDLEHNSPIILAEGRSFVDLLGETAGVGKIVKGVNTTVDVGVNEIPKQAAKWGFSVSKTGVPPIINTNGSIGSKKRERRNAPNKQ
jgi:hypothetical protein